MKVVMDWTARRAGGRITITGRTADGQPIKITGVDQINGGRKGFGAAETPPVATDKNGVKYALVG